MRNWMLGMLVSLLALPVYGQVTISGMTLGDVTVAAVAPGGPTCSGDTSETFDLDLTAGYDLADWVEQATGTGAVDEDNTTRTEDYFSGDSLRTSATSTFSNANTILANAAVPYDPFYSAVSFYLDSEALDDGEGLNVFAIGDSSVEALCVHVVDTTGTLTLELMYGDGCIGYGDGTSTGDDYTISLDTVYIIEVYADNVGVNTDIGGWRIFDCGSDGTECTTTPDHTYEDTAMEILTGTTDRVNLGFTSGSAYMDEYFGFLEVDSSQVCN